MRRGVPNRCPVLRDKVTWRDDKGREHGVYVTCGFDPAAMREGRAELVHVFIRPRGSVTSDRAFDMDDVGVVISRALQHGDEIGAMVRGAGRLHNPVTGESDMDAPRSMVGAALAAAQRMAWHAANEWRCIGRGAESDEHRGL